MEKVINVITLGDSGVGKTSIINRIKDGTFKNEYSVTINIDHFFIRKKYEKKNLIIKLVFRDTAGQEIYKTMPLNYIRDCHVVLLVFSNIDSLNEIKSRWYNYYKENANEDNSRFLLVGNKSDIFGENREDIINQGQSFADEIEAHFITCSAKSEDNMDNLERFITTEAKRFIDDEERYNNVLHNISRRFNIDKNDSNNAGSGCKCKSH